MRDIIRKWSRDHIPINNLQALDHLGREPSLTEDHRVLTMCQLMSLRSRLQTDHFKLQGTDVADVDELNHLEYQIFYVNQQIEDTRFPRH